MRPDPPFRSASAATAAKARQERELIERCLAGESAAWDELYQSYHGALLVAIRGLLGSRQSDPNVTEEIAARVWYAVVTNGGRLLDQFDVNRGACLITYLATIARSEASGMFRAEKRRRLRELLASHSPLEDQTGEVLGEAFRFDEFRATLTTREREFFDRELMCPPEECGESLFTPANRWQLRSRIKGKLRLYIREQSS